MKKISIVLVLVALVLSSCTQVLDTEKDTFDTKIASKLGTSEKTLAESKIGSAKVLVAFEKAVLNTAPESKDRDSALLGSSVKKIEF